MQSEEGGEESFRKLVSTFTPESMPEILAFTGGEPLLRPRLVRDLALRARESGTRIVLASGLFFARNTSTPHLIAEAIGAVDHFTASIDQHHELEVSRREAFRVLHEVLDRGISVSIHIAGLSDGDPYLSDISDAIRREFQDQVPMVAATIAAVGRAKEWLDANRLIRSPLLQKQDEIAPEPCDFANWPVVRHDGIVYACSSQEALDRHPPAHLRLGHASTDDWGTLRTRLAESSMLRGIRTFGPEYMAQRYGDGKVRCDGLCSTCLRLSDHPQIAEQSRAAMQRPAITKLERHIAQLQLETFTRRRGAPSYAHLAQLGYSAAKT